MSELEFIAMGSGSSGMVPELRCVIQPPDSSQKNLPCQACMSTIDADGNILPDEKNRRGNVSGLFRKTAEDGSQTAILIDVGKSFVQNSLKYFRKYNVARIDAVFLTHEHADAIMGVGDLRNLTIEGCVQDYVDVYCDARTYERIGHVFPYCVPGKLSSGSGVLGQLRWHIIEHGKALDIGTIEVLPLEVQHGTDTIKGPISEPLGLAEDPDHGPPTPPGDDTPPFTPVEGRMFPPGSTRVPYMVLSFLIDRTAYYCSDTNRIPSTTWNRLMYPEMSASSVVGIDPTLLGPPHQYSLLVLDLDMWNIHPAKSHLSVAEHLRIATDFGAAHTIAVGMGHGIEYEEYSALCRGLQGEEITDPTFVATVAWMEEYGELWKELVAKKPSMLTGYDGMRVRSRNGEVISG